MDNFLQLVPMEADADSDSALVYGEEEDLVVHGDEAHETLDESIGATTAAQFFDPLSHFTATPVGAGLQGEEVSGQEDSGATNTPAQERALFLQKLLSMEKLMLAAQADVDRRLEAVRRVHSLRDPTEQLLEYLPLLVEQSSQSQRLRSTSATQQTVAVGYQGSEGGRDAAAAAANDYDDEDEAARLAAELLESARLMSDARDAEVALLAAFVFACDGPRDSHSQRRNPNSIVPAIAALLEESTDTMDSHLQHEREHHSF